MVLYYCTDGETVEGPVPLDVLQGFLNAGDITSSTLVCAEGTAEWIFINAVQQQQAASSRGRGRRSRRGLVTSPEYEDVLRNVGFTRRQRANKSLHILQGMLLGFSLDGVISPEELKELKAWVADQHHLFAKHPFSEIVPKVNFAVQSGRFSVSDRDDLVWLCQQLSEQTPYYDAITSDMQRLHGLLHGVLADGKLLDEEVVGLHQWMKENNCLKRSFPYDELFALIHSALQDGAINEEERSTLVHFFERFITYSAGKRADNVFESGVPSRRLSGICAFQPDVAFVGNCFCFTGASSVAPRKRIAAIVEELGGRFSCAVSRQTDYLIIGEAGNPAWAYACYGRKVEEAMKLRAEGATLLLVHERDFWPKVESLRGSPVLP
jgi:hypothetical protein